MEVDHMKTSHSKYKISLGAYWFFHKMSLEPILGNECRKSHLDTLIRKVGKWVFNLILCLFIECQGRMNM